MAVRAGVSMVDLGGHTGIVREELTLGPKARDAGVAIVPDCGMAPGMNLTLAAYGMELLHRAEHVFILEGGLPQDPRPPWSYELTFNVEGLTNEYTGVATFLRNGRLAEVPALTELETLDAPGLGPLEAIVTSGGLSTAPWSFHGILTTLQNKTLRHPGHWAKMIAFRDLGLFDTDPVKIDGARVVPRHVFHALFEPQVTRGPVRDVCAIFVRVIGRRGGSPAAAVVNLIDRYDEVTGFTAMKRLTGWHGAIVAEMIAAGWIPPGAHPVELGVPPRPFVREALKRGLVIDARLEPALKVTA
jgi:lysine 6-dehydrogenase